MSDTTTGYCVKCKAKKEMTGATKTEFTRKGGGKTPAMKGTCAECKTGMFRILPRA